MKILVADDEVKLRDLLKDFLSNEGFEVLLAEDGKEAIKLFEENSDLSMAILDVMMPYVDGWRVCREIRKASRTLPIIMLTARSEEADELESFERGANDYIPKPFSLNVLLARIMARLQQPEKDVTANMLKCGELSVNMDTHDVLLKDKSLELTPIEFELITLFLRNKGRVYSREQLLTQIWGYEYYGGDRTVDTHMGRLRSKLGGFGDKNLKTVRGYGYKLEEK